MILLDSEHFGDGDGDAYLLLEVKSGHSAAEGHLSLIKFSPKRTTRDFVSNLKKKRERDFNLSIH